MSPPGIKEAVADVEVKTVDIQACAVTTAKLGGSAVTTAKLADENVSDAKLNLDVGRWASGSFVSGTTTWTGTAAFTVLQGIIKVTAAAAGLVTFGTTADADAIMNCTSTLATTFASGAGLIALNAVVNVITAQNTGIPDISAGGSVIISAAASVAGKYYFLYIATAV